jgi:hypothetical protein
MQSDPTFPALEPLDVDGKNFANACAKVLSWQEDLSETNALAVTIANHTPVSNRIKLYAHSWILSLSCRPFPTYQASVLSISRDMNDWDDEPLPLTTPYLEPKALGTAFIHEFLLRTQLYDITRLHITRCFLQESYLALDPIHLTLEQIPYVYKNDGFDAFSRKWRSSSLEVIDTYFFNDDTLVALHDTDHTAAGGPHVHSCRNFTIVDCSKLFNICSGRGGTKTGVRWHIQIYVMIVRATITLTRAVACTGFPSSQCIIQNFKGLALQDPKQNV